MESDEGFLQRWCKRRSLQLLSRSDQVVAFFSLRMAWVAATWVALAVLVTAPRLAVPVAPVRDPFDMAAIALPYLTIILAPLLGYWVAAGAYPLGGNAAQPRFRMAIYGRWQKISAIEAQQHPRYGPAGLMASLLVGLLLNIPFRFFEFVMAVPAMNGNSPAWGQALFLAMAAENCAMSFLYMVCFVMALRSKPLFPRMLAFVWLLDIQCQLALAEFVGHAGGLPQKVAEALQSILTGNIEKVLISIFVWLPYLLLSARVNITYRCRARANCNGGPM